MLKVDYFAVQPDQPKSRLIEKNSNFDKFIFFISIQWNLVRVTPRATKSIYIELIGPNNQKVVL